jgi:hypothetical protein
MSEEKERDDVASSMIGYSCSLAPDAGCNVNVNSFTLHCTISGLHGPNQPRRYPAHTQVRSSPSFTRHPRQT